MRTFHLLLVFISLSTRAYSEYRLTNIVNPENELKISERNFEHVNEDSIKSNKSTPGPDIHSMESTNFVSDFKGIVEIGFGIKVSTYGYHLLKLNAIYGYHFPRDNFVGLGTGLRLYLDNDALFGSFAAYPIIPFFVDYRIKFNDKNIAPYLSLDIGYSFDASESFKGLGLMLSPTLGLSFKKTTKSSTNLGIGYEMQSAEWYGLNGSKKISGAISINVGSSF